MVLKSYINLSRIQEMNRKSSFEFINFCFLFSSFTVYRLNGDSVWKVADFDGVFQINVGRQNSIESTKTTYNFWIYCNIYLFTCKISAS